MAYPLTAIISDLHGNRQAVEACLADAEARGARRFVCLGDIVGYGAEPRACLDAVMGRCVPAPSAEGAPLEPGICLKGNHEEALLFSADDFNPKARAAIEWTREEVSRDPARADAYWDFIGELEASAADDVAMYAHGSPRDPVREYVVPRDIRDREKMGALFGAMVRPICFIGHSHVPVVLFEDGAYFVPKAEEPVCGPYDLGDLEGNRAIVNVGSVGQPRDGDPRLSYVLFDGRNVTFVRADYDHAAAAAAIRAVPELPEFLADRLANGR
ncbi:MAG: metallophosphoesterase family protein [Planctomycetota bacterium]|nr:metallophosphoesterase family protein [Planctomycetota bacterium]MDG1985738.1 metallophosphoesterase family protein [Planctomycetota bacterium]